MNERRFMPLLAALALAAAAAPATAQQSGAAPNYKVGFVNAERVMRESRTSKQAQSVLEDEFTKREKEIAGGPPQEAARRRSALVEDMNLRRNEVLKEIVDRATAIIRRIATAENFDIVLYEAVYAGPQADLTDRVTKELDAAR